MNLKLSNIPTEYNQSSTLIEIEEFMSSLIARGIPYAHRWNRHERRVFCDRVLGELPRMLRFYEPDHEYSEHIEGFWHACEKVGLLDCGSPTALVSRLRYLNSEGAAFVEEFVSWVLHYAHGERFRRKAYDRHYEQIQKRNRLNAYVRGILALFSRTLVLRLDLGYFKDAIVDIADVYAHLDKLMDIIHCRYGMFLNAIGYAWCIEQGKSKGYHIHFSVFFPGYLHQRDGYLAKQMGELWKEVSDGHGTYHSCNAEKDRYEAMGTRGIGMIHRDNTQELENAVSAICYLADPEKNDQYLRIKPMGRRTYAKGSLGQPKK